MKDFFIVYAVKKKISEELFKEQFQPRLKKKENPYQKQIFK